MYDLQEGAQYALSTEDKSNKSLFFVKLTDSALQSIEMSLNSEAISCKPTIQFENNRGTISLPINGNKQNYGFTLSNMDVGGLFGSFQCVQHTRDRCFESLGTMLKKIHINAREDSYEKTKFRMAVAEKEQKSFCTKEIKPSGTSFGRKVRLKPRGHNKFSEKQHPAAKVPGSVKFASLQKLAESSGLLKQTIRKRIIHILAVKPYKKLDLLVRLMKEGINNGEKNEINDVLTSVGTLKGNLYHLAVHAWKEMQDDWKFCSKEELKLIQRRKQQFLKTVKENGVGSSKSLDNFSPTKSDIASDSSNAETAMPLGKKRRLAHNSTKFTDEVTTNNTSGLSNSGKIKLQGADHVQKLHNPTLRVNGSCNGVGNVNNLLDSLKLKKKSARQGSKCDIAGLLHDVSSKQKFMLPDFLKTDESKCNNSKSGQLEAAMSSSHADNHQNGALNYSAVNSRYSSQVCGKNLTNSYCEENELCRYESSKKCSTPVDKTNHHNGISSVFDVSKQISPVTCCNSFHSTLNNKESKTSVGSDAENSSVTNLPPDFNSFNYVKEYKKIESMEQRSLYAKEFNSEYGEYLKLHSEMKGISEKFGHLLNCLSACEGGSNDYKKIRAKIIKEYGSTLLNSDYNEAWKKFNFLHSKLSHIKKLITEYDSAQCEES